MHLDLARTFVEVVAAGSFVRAAERLHISQTAVSARIQALEAQLGRSVFVRNKTGARLTPAGQKFLQYATQLVQVWERARQQVALPPGREALLSLGGEFSLSGPFMLNWLAWLHSDRPTVALRAEVDAPDRLMDHVQIGLLDIAILYAPYHRPGVEITPVLEEELIAVTTDPDQHTLASDNYVYVDWGADFTAHHDLVFPHLKDAGVFVGLGPLALRYVLSVGGAGYFRTRAVESLLAGARLFRIKNAPSFSYSVYAAFSEKSDADLIGWARNGLMLTATAPADPWF